MLLWLMNLEFGGSEVSAATPAVADIFGRWGGTVGSSIVRGTIA